MGFGVRALLTGSAALAAAAAAPAAVPGATYVTKAGAGDLYEIRSSEVVLRSTTDPALKSFAQQMVSDHAKSTALVKAAAAKAAVKARPATLDAQQKADMVALNRAGGAERDRLYIAQQKQAHNAALALQQDYAAGGDTPALKDAAQQIVPVVQHHIDMLNGLGS